MKLITGFMIFMSFATPALAEQRNVFVGVKSGFGDMQVTEGYAADGISEDSDVFSAALYGGYNFDFGLVAEAELSGETSDDILFESYDVSQVIVMLGYTFEVENKFRIIPKAGLSSWELDTYDSNFLFGEEISRTFDGTDMVWSVEGEYSFNGLFQLNLGYRHGSYDFGGLDAFRVGAEFDF